MYVKLNISWQGKAAGRIIEIDDKHYGYVLQNKIGVKVSKPAQKKAVEPNYETKEEKKVVKRTRKKKVDATDNNESS